MRRLIVLLAAVAATLATARLGLWQLERAAQKAALAAGLHERGALPMLPAAELARGTDQLAAQLHRRIELRGHWIAEHTIYLDNRTMNGRAGFIVAMPLLLGPGDAVLVQRGWVARDAADPRRLPPLATPAHEVAIVGRIAGPPSRLYEFEAVATGAIRQNLDLDAHAREIGVALRPLSLLQESAAASDDALLRHWQQNVADGAKNHGYAVQWFALSALIAGLYVWFQLIAPWRRGRS